MYKLLLISDQKDVLDAYEQIDNWEFNGFRKPHIRHDLEGAKQSLQIHHADAIILDLENRDKLEIFRYLRANYPLLPLCMAGKTTEDAKKYLAELLQMLNWLHADFASEAFDEQKMMIRARRHFFRNLVSGKKAVTRDELKRKLLMLRSRMEPEKPCILLDLEQDDREGDLPEYNEDTDHLLERELFQSIGGDYQGFHVLPLVTQEGEVFILAGSLRGKEQTEDLQAMLERCMRDGMQHAEEYRGLHLRMKSKRTLPSIYALCTDYTE